MGKWLYHIVAFLVVAVWGSTFVFTKLLLLRGLSAAQIFTLRFIIAYLLFLGCVASMLCFVAWNWVLKRLGAMTATNYVYFNPVTTVLFAWLVLKEQITVYFLTGTLLILLGMYLADRKRPEVHIPPTYNTE